MDPHPPRTIGAAAPAQPTSVHSTRLPVLGVPVDFAADAPVLLDAVEAALGWWRLLDYCPGLVSRRDQPPRIRLLLDEAESDREGNVAVRSPEIQRLELEGPGIRGHADGAALTATCTLTPSVVRDRCKFEEQILAPLSLFLVTRCNRQPVHAAAITRNGRALLLVGPSGAGKSTLAYAALRSGWNVLADDAVYLQAERVRRIWARPARLHLPTDAVRRFPELANRPLVRRENGRLKIAFEPPGTWPAAMRPLEHATLCLLASDPVTADAEPIDVDAAIGTVLRTLDPGFDVFRDTIGPALRAVTGARAWVVRTGPDPLRTVALLEELESR